eukprot:PhF_6_TR29191/c0_g1_i2/m.42710
MILNQNLFGGIVRVVIFGLLTYVALSRPRVRKTVFHLKEDDDGIEMPVYNSTTMTCTSTKILMKTKNNNTKNNNSAIVSKAFACGENCNFCVDRQRIKRAIIEIGTNNNPEYGPYVRKNKDVFFIAVEPIPIHYDTMVTTMTTGNQPLSRDRFVAVPAVVSPGDGFATFHIAKKSVCSSLMASSNKKYGKCAALRTKLEVPKVSLDSLVSLVPNHISISVISIDAQGYDLVVASTLTLAAQRRIRVIVMECQDLPYQDAKQRWLYHGSYNCDTIRGCMESPRWGGFVLDACVNNHRERDPRGVLVGEFNCFYRRQFVPSSEVDQYHNCSATPEFCRTKLRHMGESCPF